MSGGAAAKFRLERVISGGQTGADEAGLRAARKAGLKTGGMMPRGWRTEVGPRPDIAELYGMTESLSSDYRQRTLENIAAADATLVLGNANSAGSKSTILQANVLQKPLLVIPRGFKLEEPLVRRMVNWLAEMDPRVLNVAGNRESVSPGIGIWAENLLSFVFGMIRGAQR